MAIPPTTADGTYLNVDLTLAPEYYVSYDKDGNATVDWDALSDGATMHYGMVVDKMAPTVSNVNLGTDAEGNKVLTFTAGDDQYMSAVALLDYDKGSVVSKSGRFSRGRCQGCQPELHPVSGRFYGYPSAAAGVRLRRELRHLQAEPEPR